MRIKDIELSDVAGGKNWRLSGVDKDRWWEEPMEEWEIEPAPALGPDDHAVYSAVYVLDDGKVEPLLLLKEVSSREYGGDYCEFVNGSWRQLGLVPNPDAPFGTEYVANPHPADRSFIDRASQTMGFLAHVSRMRRI
jgi:hypothetical protein